MRGNNFNNLIIVTSFLIGVIVLLLSYFEEGTTSLIYQLISLVVLTVSAVFLFIENIKFSRNHKEKKIGHEYISEEFNRKERKKEEDMFKKNIVSIELEETDYADLTEDEQKLMNKLNKNEGSMEQRDITKKIFKDNKVKAHRVISSLEEKDLVIKRKDGKTNKIFLK
ncbi:hypothetical protein C0585_02190 [Candidatus Woesearchaeota archaeon]|nr:MAG: hypothetical protein C0585_02190 [Candidatus Woesearchaeota archaeon]